MMSTEFSERPSSGPPLRSRFSALMWEHHLELLVYSRGIVRDHSSAQDIVQESLVAAWKKFAEFDEEKDFGAWVRGIIRNKSMDWFRKQKREPMPDVEMVEMEIDLADWQSENAAGVGIFEKVEACLQKLPEHMKEAVQTFYFQDREGSDAAEQLGITAGNLRKRLQRARTLLYQCLTTEEAEETLGSELTNEVSHGFRALANPSMKEA